MENSADNYGKADNYDYKTGQNNVDNVDNALEKVAQQQHDIRQRASDYEAEMANAESNKRSQFGFFWVLFVNNLILLSRRYITVTIIIGAPVLYIFIARTQRMNAYLINFTKIRDGKQMALNGCDGREHLSKYNINYRCAGYKKQVLYFPKTTTTERIMSRINYTSTGYSIERVFNENYKKVDIGFTAAIEFENFDLTEDTMPEEVKYTIKMNKNSVFSNTVFPSKRAFPPQSRDLVKHAENYYISHFLAVQRAIDLSIIKEFSNDSKINDLLINVSQYLPQRSRFLIMDIKLQAFPMPKYVHDTYYDSNINDLSFVAAIFLFYMINLISDILTERENKIKESLKMLGIRSMTQWTASICTYLLPMMVTNLVLTIALSMSVNTDPLTTNKLIPVKHKLSDYYMENSMEGSVLRSCLGGIPQTMIFLLLSVYGLASLLFTLLLSTILQGQRHTSTLVLLLIAVILYLTSWVISLSELKDLSLVRKFALNLNFYHPFSSVFKYMHFRDILDVPVSWDDMSHKVHDGSFGVSMYEALMFLSIDVLIFFFLAWYMDKIYPGEYGVPENIFFVISPTFWFNIHMPWHSAVPECTDSDLPVEDHEPFDKDRAIGIKVINLSKRYTWSGPLAIDNLSLDILYEDITVLLGYNGSGKSTLLLTLTGFYGPSSGDAIINGYQLTTELGSIQKSLGICPQHDILYPYLTFDEHLRGTVPNWDKIDEMIDNFDMTRKKHLTTSVLSGGEKRKLSVIMALMGDSKVVILDEPSSGMDPESRRVLWRLLKRERFGRTIIISTHYMDEADYLGDRILILSNGKLHCSGSPAFLKKKFGTGYLLNCELAKASMIPTIKNYMSQKMPLATVERETEGEIIFLLPIDEIDKYRNFFWYFDGAIASLGIKSYSVSSTSLEDVFSKTIARTVMPDTNREKGLFSYAKLIGYSKYEKYTSTFDIVLHQLYGLTVMRIYQMYRNPFMLMFRVIMPIILFVCLFYIVNSVSPAQREFSVKDFGKSIIRIAFKNKNETKEIMDNPTVGNSFINHNFGLINKGFHGGKGKSVNDHYDSFLTYAKQLSPQITIRELQDKTTNPVYTDLKKIAKETKLLEYFYKQFIGITFYQLKDQIYTHISFSEQAMHTLPIAINIIDNALLKMYAGDKYSIVTSTLPLMEKSPLKNTVHNFEMDRVTLSYLMCLLPVIIAVMLSFIPNALSDRLGNLRASMILSGLHPSVMWVNIITMDTLFLAVSMVTTMVTMHFLDNMFPLIDVLYFSGFLVITGIASLAAIHIVSNILSSALHAVSITCIYVVLFTSLYYTVEKEYQPIVQKMNPITNMVVGVVNFFDHRLDVRACSLNGVTCFDVAEHYCCKDCKGDTCMLQQLYSFDDRGLGKIMVYALIHFIVIMTLIMIAELRFIDIFIYAMSKAETVGHAEQEDEDIAVEREKVDELHRIATKSYNFANKETRIKREVEYEDNVLLLHNVVKTYKCCVLCNLDQFRPMVAVKGVCLSISKNECFGLLGVNGAGKSTLFKMMTGSSSVDGGDIYVHNSSVKKCSFKGNMNVGYCAQENIMFDFMNADEHLYLYGRIRGLKHEYLTDMIEAMVSMFFLTMFRKIPSNTLSGGNKRKLAMAISMVSTPSLLFLDEPTSGMDPVSRRSVWDSLENYRKTQGTIVLTSHSMDECEELCTRLVIMVNGRFQCIGSQTHLKTKFGHGCTLMVYLSKDTDLTLTIDEQKEKFRPIIDLIADNFPGTRLMEVKQLTLKFNVPQEMVDWSNLFGTMEKAKQIMEIEHYTMAQTTLEKIFITFAEDRDLYNME